MDYPNVRGRTKSELGVGGMPAVESVSHWRNRPPGAPLEIGAAFCRWILTGGKGGIRSRCGSQDLGECRNFGLEKVSCLPFRSGSSTETSQHTFQVSPKQAIACSRSGGQRSLKRRQVIVLIPGRENERRHVFEFPSGASQVTVTHLKRRNWSKRK